MAAVSILANNVVTAGGTTTAAGTPALGDLIVIVTCYTGITTAVAPTDNNPDGHGTYTQITSALKNTSADFLGMWVRADGIQRAVSTTFSIAPGASSGGGLLVMKITGMTISGPAAVRQSGSQANQASGTPTLALSVGAALTGNPLISAVFNATNPSGMTAPTSWTLSNTGGYATPTTGIAVAKIDSGFTASSVTWGSAGGVFSAIAAEFNANAGATSIFPARGAGALDVTQADSPRLRAVKDGAW